MNPSGDLTERFVEVPQASTPSPSEWMRRHQALHEASLATITAVMAAALHRLLWR